MKSLVIDIADTMYQISRDLNEASETSDFDEMKQSLRRAIVNSALEPARIFSTADSAEQLKVRIDDKLNRVKNNQGYAGDNDIDDLIGYLVLYKIAKAKIDKSS